MCIDIWYWARTTAVVLVVFVEQIVSSVSVVAEPHKTAAVGVDSYIAVEL